MNPAQSLIRELGVTLRTALEEGANVIKAAGGLGVVATDITGDLVSAGLSNAMKVGGNAGNAAVGAVTGVLHGANRINTEAGVTVVSAEDAATAACVGAINAADKVGGRAGQVVRNALMRAIDIPREVVQRALGQK